jgi:signal transduction histidine kinase
VADNGIGFDEKHLDLVFTIFQRLHGRGEHEGDGMGWPFVHGSSSATADHHRAQSIRDKMEQVIMNLVINPPPPAQ